MQPFDFGQFPPVKPVISAPILALPAKQAYCGRENAVILHNIIRFPYQFASGKPLCYN
jgi:hypothetical protein